MTVYLLAKVRKLDEPWLLVRNLTDGKNTYFEKAAGAYCFWEQLMTFHFESGHPARFIELDEEIA